MRGRRHGRGLMLPARIPATPGAAPPTHHRAASAARAVRVWAGGRWREDGAEFSADDTWVSSLGNRGLRSQRPPRDTSPSVGSWVEEVKEKARGHTRLDWTQEVVSPFLLCDVIQVRDTQLRLVNARRRGDDHHPSPPPSPPWRWPT